MSQFIASILLYHHSSKKEKNQSTIDFDSCIDMLLLLSLKYSSHQRWMKIKNKIKNKYVDVDSSHILYRHSNHAPFRH